MIQNLIISQIEIGGLIKPKALQNQWGNLDLENIPTNHKDKNYWWILVFKPDAISYQANDAKVFQEEM